jgi:hypothetical protein
MSDFEDYVPKCVPEFSEGFIKYNIKRIDHQDNIYRITFKDGLLTPGVIIPDNLGFKPETDMKVIWDNDGCLGTEGYLSFYDQQGKQLCALHRERVSAVWTNVTPKEAVKEPEYTDENGKLTLAGIEKAMGKPVEELLKDPANREAISEILSDGALKKILEIPDEVKFTPERRETAKRMVKEYGRMPTREELDKKLEDANRMENKGRWDKIKEYYGAIKDNQAELEKLLEPKVDESLDLFEKRIVLEARNEINEEKIEKLYKRINPKLASLREEEKEKVEEGMNPKQAQKERREAVKAYYNKKSGKEK